MSERTIISFWVRHGATTLNQENCFRGPLNPPLAAQGVRDAHRLAFYFQGIDVSRIIASDKLRSMQTAKIIASSKGMTVEPNPDLHAWDVGEFGGKPKNKENVSAVQYYVTHPDEPVPGGESLNHFRAVKRPMYFGSVELFEEDGIPPLIVVHSSLIHELGNIANGNTTSVLVHPGGVAALYMQDGKLGAEAIFKPDLERTSQKRRADVVS